MSVSEPRKFIVHFPRAGCVVGSLIFGPAAYGVLIYYTQHQRDFDPRYGVESALWWWFIFVCVAGSLLICAKTAVIPSLLFAADSSGVRLGRGIFVNRMVNVEWRRIADVRASTISLPMNPSGIVPRVPALEIVFDPSVVLPSTGLNLEFASGGAFYLAQSTIGCSLRCCDQIDARAEERRGESAIERHRLLSVGDRPMRSLALMFPYPHAVRAFIASRNSVILTSSSV